MDQELLDNPSKLEEKLNSIDLAMEDRSETWPILHLFWVLIFTAVMMAINRKKLDPGIPDGIPLG